MSILKGQSKITQEMCDAAIKSDIREIVNVPKHLMTRELCETAAAIDKRAIGSFPPELKMEHITRYFSEPRIRDDLTENMGYYLLSLNPKNIEMIPENLRTLGMCLKAIKSDENLLQFLSPRMRIPDSYARAICVNYKVLGLLPESLKTLGLCRLAYSVNPDAINLMPDSLKKSGVKGRCKWMNEYGEYFDITGKKLFIVDANENDDLLMRMLSNLKNMEI